MKHDVDYRIIDLDDDRSLLFLTGNHRTFFVDQDLASRMRSGLDQLSAAEADEWDRLVAIGAVADRNAEILRGSTFEDGANLALNINLTNVCNLNCTYCFAEGGDYGRITEAMGPQSVDDVFSFIDANITRTNAVRFEFFGGEPLANFSIIDEICRRAEEVTAVTGTRFIHRISTNLTLMPKGALDLFARHRFIVSVSLDGGREAQDANRPTKSGRGSFDRIIENVRRVREASDDITLVGRMTIVRRSPTLLESVRELWTLNVFDYLQIYPGVFAEESTARLTVGRKGQAPAASRPRYINFFLQEGMVDQFRELLDAYPDLFVAGNRFKGVLEYERTVQMVLEGLLALAFCSGGRTYFTHSPDRSISPCHRLVGEPSFDVGTGEVGIARRPDDWRLPVDDHEVCGRCWARYVCGGGCRQENYVATGDINRLNEESCNYQLLLTEEVLRSLGRSTLEYRARSRSELDDLFVSCGRPVMANGRDELGDEAGTFRHFVPLEQGR